MGVISTIKKVKRCKNKTRKMGGGGKYIIINVDGTKGS